VSVSGGEWQPAGNDINYSESELDLDERRHFKLSFRLEVRANLDYHIAMLPLYTYSQLLDNIERLEDLGRLRLECLTQSISGMAIPLLTFESPSNEPKNVVLISGRVHPG
jgi:hypothetical protein